jgi:hypothetical protein
MMAEAKEEVDDGEGEEMGAVAWDQRNWYWCGGPAGVHDEPVENLVDKHHSQNHDENHHNEKLEEKLLDEIHDENHHSEKLEEKLLDEIHDENHHNEKLEEKLLDENHNHMYWVEIDQHLVEETAIRPLNHVEMINLQLEDDHHLHDGEQDQEE